MPGYDGTGPLGEGPKTGGLLGYCRDGLLYLRGLRRPKAQLSNVGSSGLEDKSEENPTADTVEAKVGTGLGPCGNGIPRGSGQGLGRGYHGGRD